MAKVTWSPGIEHVSGALAKPGNNPQHSCSKMLLATHRVAETTNHDCNRLYLRSKVERSTAPSQDEMAVREKFATVSAAVAARAKDLTKMAADKAAFIAQKDLSGGRRTMKSFLWKLEVEAYDQAQG